MAVTQPFAPNLSGAYGNIQQALEQSAQIAGKNTGPLGSVAAGLKPVADVASERSQEMFKAGIEDQLAKNKIQYMTAAEGKSLWTQDDVNTALAKEHPNLDPKNYPQVGKAGFMATPEEVTKLEEHGLLQADITNKVDEIAKTDPKKASTVELLMRAGDTQGAARLMGAGPIKWMLDNSTGYHIAVDQFGSPVPGMQPLEAYGGKINPTNGDVKVTKLDQLDPITKRSVIPAISKAVSDPDINKDINKLYQIQDLKKAVMSNNPLAVINVKSETGQAIGGMAPGRMVGRIMEQEETDPREVQKIKSYFEKNWGSGGMTDTVRKETLDMLNDTETQIRQRVDQNISAKGKEIVNVSNGKLDEGAARSMVSPKWEGFNQSYPAQSAPKPPNAASIKSAITNYLTAKKIPITDQSMQDVINQVKSDPNKLSGLMSKYGK